MYGNNVPMKPIIYKIASSFKDGQYDDDNDSNSGIQSKFLNEERDWKVRVLTEKHWLLIRKELTH